MHHDFRLVEGRGRKQMTDGAHQTEFRVVRDLNLLRIETIGREGNFRNLDDALL